MKKVNTEEIEEILRESGVSFKTNTRSLIMDCPRCSKRDKLYLDRNTGRFICWVCAESDNFQGKPEFALTELSSLSIRDIQERIYSSNSSEDFSIKALSDPYNDTEEGLIAKEIEIFPPVVAFPESFVDLDSSAGAKGLSYLLGRGIPLDIAQKYGIKFSTKENRVVFPVQYKGLLFGWQGRYINKTEFTVNGKEIKIAKALTSQGLVKAHTLMFRDNLIDSDHVIICEGPVDAIKADLCGGAVCTMGKAISNEQLKIIQKHNPKKIYLSLDPDAYIETGKVSNYLMELGFEVYDMRAPSPYKDLGEMPFKEVRELFDKARRFTGNEIFFDFRSPIL